MNFTTYKFETCHELNTFLQENKDKIIGKQIQEYYCYLGMSDVESCEPIVMIIGDICFSMHYLFLSSLEINTFSKETYKSDTTLNFLYKDVPGSKKLEYSLAKDVDFPFYGLKIRDITISPYSLEIITNPSTGEKRPEGGDYFSVIKFIFENDAKLCICAASSTCDGYTDVWFE